MALRKECPDCVFRHNEKIEEVWNERILVEDAISNNILTYRTLIARLVSIPEAELDKPVRIDNGGVNSTAYNYRIGCDSDDREIVLQPN